jgi:hypothetical protein
MVGVPRLGELIVAVYLLSDAAAAASARLLRNAALFTTPSTNDDIL